MNPLHGCEVFMRGWFADKGIEVTVSDQPPLVEGPYTVHPFICPHGVKLWPEPTGEQIATWARERTP